MSIYDYLEEVRNILRRQPLEDIDKAIEVLKKARADGRRIFIMGNGGSGSTASHITGDLSKACRMDVSCLNDNVPVLTAWANDDHYGNAFWRQMDNIVKAQSVVIAISGSGQSGNIVSGIASAASLGAITIALTGQAGTPRGGGVVDHADISVIVPSDNMQQIEDVHLMIGHMIATALREE